MLKIGDYNTLKIVKILNFGAYVDGEEWGEILVPFKYLPELCNIGDSLDLFIYFDTSDTIIATTETPLAKVGDFACLEVVDSNEIGAFMNWGVLKDLFIPHAEQACRMIKGRSYAVYIYYDKQSKRIVGSSKIGKFLKNSDSDICEDLEVDLLVVNKLEIGYKAVINNQYLGMIYKNEIFRNIRIGDKLTGFIKKIREDGKIDLTLSKSNKDDIVSLSQKIIMTLEKQDGIIAIGDKSPKEEIYRVFGVSKKKFKVAIGNLYKQKIISLAPTSIRLLKNPLK